MNLEPSILSRVNFELSRNNEKVRVHKYKEEKRKRRKHFLKTIYQRLKERKEDLKVRGSEQRDKLVELEWALDKD